MRTVSVVHNVFKTENNALYIIPAYKESKKKAVSQEKSRLTAFLCPIRSQCCTNYNAPTGALDSKSTDSLLRLFNKINEAGQTILMVTHSTKAASHANRILFIKDGEVYHQLYRGSMTNEQLYSKIQDTLTLLMTGGDLNE